MIWTIFYVINDVVAGYALLFFFISALAPVLVSAWAQASVLDVYYSHFSMVWLLRVYRGLRTGKYFLIDWDLYNLGYILSFFLVLCLASWD